MIAEVTAVASRLSTVPAARMSPMSTPEVRTLTVPLRTPLLTLESVAPELMVAPVSEPPSFST